MSEFQFRSVFERSLDRLKTKVRIFVEAPWSWRLLELFEQLAGGALRSTMLKVENWEPWLAGTLCLLEWNKHHTFFNAVFLGSLVVGILTGGRDTLDALIIVVLVAGTLGGTGTV